MYKIGSAKFTGTTSDTIETAVYISKDGAILGKYIFKNEYRTGLKELFTDLPGYEKHILSGDNESERANLEQICSINDLHFNQSLNKSWNISSRCKTSIKRLQWLVTA